MPSGDEARAGRGLVRNRIPDPVLSRLREDRLDRVVEILLGLIDVHEGGRAAPSGMVERSSAA